MDRRQKKTRNAIFTAFLNLLSVKDFNSISVQEIIDEADVGRATFYAHFETKDFLLKTICEELFGHIVNSALGKGKGGHYEDCNEQGGIFIHLLRHLEKNDDNVLQLLISPNNELFLRYFKEALKETVDDRLNLKDGSVPREYIVNHISSTFVETVIWWTKNGKKETPEKLAEYLTAVLGELEFKY